VFYWHGKKWGKERRRSGGEEGVVVWHDLFN
jgi:hypothetical protein